MLPLVFTFVAEALQLIRMIALDERYSNRIFGMVLIDCSGNDTPTRPGSTKKKNVGIIKMKISVIEVAL